MACASYYNPHILQVMFVTNFTGEMAYGGKTVVVELLAGGARLI